MPAHGALKKPMKIGTGDLLPKKMGQKKLDKNLVLYARNASNYCAG